MDATDTVILNCPVCGRKSKRQSKARGWNTDGSEFGIGSIPIEIAAELHGAPFYCPSCVTTFEAKVQSIVTIHLSDPGDEQ